MENQGWILMLKDVKKGTWFPYGLWKTKTGAKNGALICLDHGRGVEEISAPLKIDFSSVI